jgi:hypothetical protein
MVSPTTSPRAAAAAADEFPAFDAFDAFGSGGPPAPAPAPSTVVAGQSAADDFFASMMSAPAPAPTQPQQPAPAMTMMGTVQPSRGSTQGGMSGGGGGDLISGFSSAPAPAANRCGLPACCRLLPPNETVRWPRMLGCAGPGPHVSWLTCNAAAAAMYMYKAKGYRGATSTLAAAAAAAAAAASRAPPPRPACRATPR